MSYPRSNNRTRALTISAGFRADQLHDTILKTTTNQEVHNIHNTTPQQVSHNLRAVADSGASQIFVTDESVLIPSSIHTVPRITITTADKCGKPLFSNKKETLVLKPNIAGATELIYLDNAYIMEGLARSLLGIAAFDDKEYYVEFGGGGMRIRRGPHGPNLIAIPRTQDTTIQSSITPLKIQNDYAAHGPIQFHTSADRQTLQTLYPIPDTCF